MFLLRYVRSLVVMIAFAISTDVMAMPELLFYGVGDLANLQGSNLNDPVFTRGSVAIGGGLGTEIKFGKVVGLEIDALYLARKIRQDFSSGETVNLESRHLSIPIQLMFHLSKSLMIGGGAYGSNGIGALTLSDASGQGSKYSFADAQLIRTDVGLIFTAGYDLSLGANASLTFQARYQQGLRNVGFEIPADANVKFSDIMGVIGLRIRSAQKYSSSRY